MHNPRTLVSFKTIGDLFSDGYFLTVRQVLFSHPLRELRYSLS